MISGNDMFLAVEIGTIWLLALALGITIFAELDIWLDRAISKKLKDLLSKEN